MSIWAIIPARGGSKGIPSKNIQDIGGHPLIAYSIIAAKQCKSIERVIVDTDSPYIQAVAKAYGAEAPYLRPKEFATDTALDIDWVKHALGYIKEFESHMPDMLIHLRPTTPFRNPLIIVSAFMELRSSAGFTSLRSAHLLEEHPYKMFYKEGRKFVSFLEVEKPGQEDITNHPREKFRPIYVPNGYVDILFPKQILETSSLHGNNIYAFVTDKVIEIDTQENLDLARKLYHDEPIHQHIPTLS